MDFPPEASVALSALAPMAADGLIGNDSGGAATPQHLTVAESNLLLNVATATAPGTVEIATTAEVDTGTDNVRAISPLALNGSAPVVAVTNMTGSAAGIDSDATSHAAADGSSHTFIDQSVVSGASPVLAVTNMTGSAAGLDSSATAHAAADGSSHTFLDQSVVSGASPVLAVTNMTGSAAGIDSDATTHAASDGSGHSDVAANTALVVQATQTARGTLEVATTAEVNTGTDDLRALTPLALNASAPVMAVTNMTGSAAGLDSDATAHAAADGSSHTFLDQSVVSGSTPTFTGTNFTGIPGPSVAQATDTALGALEIATTAEVTTGTDNVRAVTPSALAGAGLTPANVTWSTTSELTISSGAIAVTGGRHTVDTESDAAADNLDTINGLAAGQAVWLSPASGDRGIVLRDASLSGGTIYTQNGGSIALDELTDGALLFSIDGTAATVIARRTLAPGIDRLSHQGSVATCQAIVSGQPTATETLTIGVDVYEWDGVGGNINVTIAGSAELSYDNLVTAVNASGTELVVMGKISPTEFRLQSAASAGGTKTAASPSIVLGETTSNMIWSCGNVNMNTLGGVDPAPVEFGKSKVTMTAAILAGDLLRFSFPFTVATFTVSITNSSGVLQSPGNDVWTLNSTDVLVNFGSGSGNDILNSDVVTVLAYS